MDNKIHNERGRRQRDAEILSRNPEVNLLKPIYKLMDKIIDIIGKHRNSVIYLSLFFFCLCVVICAVFGMEKKYPFMCILGIAVLSVLVYSIDKLKESKNKLKESKNELKESKKEIEKLKLKVYPGRYFIGIKVGAKKIDYCILDHKPFIDNPNGVGIKNVAVFRGYVESDLDTTPKIYRETVKIIKRLAKVADERGFTPIHGIGIGLPGMVDPRDGTLVDSPNLKIKRRRPVVDELNRKISWDTDPVKKIIPSRKRSIPIKIDNDVRCATRFRWKRSPETQDTICISIGDGVGSGIVANGKMIYGRNFCAGEAGHTIISYTPKLFKKDERCHCGNEGHHWEMYVSTYGMLNMTKNLDPKEFKKFEKKHLRLPNKTDKKLMYYVFSLEPKHRRDLKGGKVSSTVRKVFGNNKLFLSKEAKITKEDDKNWNIGDDSKTYKIKEEKGNLNIYAQTIDLIHKAYFEEDQYAKKIVDNFFDYIAIGIANYIDILNPEEIIVEGTMIRKFYDIYKSENTLWPKICDYAITHLAARDLKLHLSESRYISCMGAALIFKDGSYFRYRNR